MDFMYRYFLLRQQAMMRRIDAEYPIQDVSCVCCGARILRNPGNANNEARPAPNHPVPPVYSPLVPRENFFDDRGFDHNSNLLTEDPYRSENPAVQDDDGFFEEPYRHIDKNEGEFLLEKDEWTMRWTVEQEKKRYQSSSRIVQKYMYRVYMASLNRRKIIFQSALLLKMLAHRTIERIRVARFELGRQNKLDSGRVCHLAGGGGNRRGTE